MSNAISADKIAEMASELELGMLVFYQQETGELVIYPDERRHPFFETEHWEEEIKKVKKGGKKFLRLEPMDVRQEIRLIQGFISEVDNIKTREQLEDTLQQRNFFSAFKRALQQTPDLLDNWYAFKTAAYGQWVQKLLKISGEDN